MDKRQKYFITENAAPQSEEKGLFSPTSPHCSYMYGGLGDIRRQPYQLKSPILHEETVPARNQEADYREPKAATPKRYCDSAAVAAKLFQSASGAPTSPSRVKVNPLHRGVIGGGKGELFHDQMSKIRRTKDREMMTAIMEAASHAKNDTRKSRLRWGRGTKRKSGGPFILRSRPPLSLIPDSSSRK